MKVLIIGAGGVGKTTLESILKNDGVEVIEATNENMQMLLEQREPKTFVVTANPIAEMPDIQFFDEKHSNDPKSFGIRKLSKKRKR